LQSRRGSVAGEHHESSDCADLHEATWYCSDQRPDHELGEESDE
jgi:hypothetical protein